MTASSAVGCRQTPPSVRRAEWTRAVRALAPNEKPESAQRIGTRDPRDREAALAGERLSLRRPTERARVKAVPEKAFRHRLIAHTPC
jgi:hypothetical protein